MLLHTSEYAGFKFKNLFVTSRKGSISLAKMTQFKNALFFVCGWALKTSLDHSYPINYLLMPHLVTPLPLLFIILVQKRLRKEWEVVCLEHAHLLAK